MIKISEKEYESLLNYKYLWDEFGKEPTKKSLFGYLGGKNKVAKQIVQLMPDHKVYVEPFFGSGAVFFAKGYKKVSNIYYYREVIGDLDNDIINLYEEIRDNPMELTNILSGFEYSQSLRKKAFSNSQYYKQADKIKKAALYIFNIMSGFSGDVNAGFAYSKKGTNVVTTFHNKISQIKKYSNRLKRAFIFNCGYQELIKKFDSLDTFFYLDPPYKDTVKYKTNIIDYKKFVDDVKSIQGNWILSHYKSEWLLKNFEGYEVVDIKHTPSVGKSTDGKRPVNPGSKECIVLSKGLRDNPKYTGNEIKNFSFERAR